MKQEKESIKIHTAGISEVFDLVTIDIQTLITDLLKSKGFVKDNLGGKQVHVKGFTFVIIEETKASITVGKKKETKTTITSITVGTDINNHKMYGKGIKLNPNRITDLILTLDYFQKMEEK